MFIVSKKIKKPKLKTRKKNNANNPSHIKQNNSHICIPSNIKTEINSIIKDFLSPLNTTSSINSTNFGNDNNEKFNYIGKKMFRVTTEEKFVKKETKCECGRWSIKEHNKFIESLYKYGNDWMKIEKFLGTRSPSQIRSHAQKFFSRLQNYKDDSIGLDFSSDFTKNLKDIIQNIKEKEQTLNKRKLLYNLSEKIRFDLSKKKIKKTKIKNKVKIKKHSLNKKNPIDLDNKNNNILSNDKDDIENEIDIKNSSDDEYFMKFLDGKEVDKDSLNMEEIYFIRKP